MNLDLYLAFLLATTVLILLPGPNVTLLVANSLAHGPRRALITLAGTSTAIALQLAGRGPRDELADPRSSPSGSNGCAGPASPT